MQWNFLDAQGVPQDKLIDIFAQQVNSECGAQPTISVADFSKISSKDQGWLLILFDAPCPVILRQPRVTKGRQSGAFSSKDVDTCQPARDLAGAIVILARQHTYVMVNSRQAIDYIVDVRSFSGKCRIWLAQPHTASTPTVEAAPIQPQSAPVRLPAYAAACGPAQESGRLHPPLQVQQTI